MASQGWRLRSFIVFSWAQFFLLTAIATYYLVAPSPGDTFANVWDKALHAACWFILVLSLKLPWLWRSKFWLGALLLFVYSIVLESLQQLTPERQFSVLDMLANGVGVLVGYILLWLIDPLIKKVLFPILSYILKEEIS